MRWFGRSSRDGARRRATPLCADVGVPDLVDPEYVRLHVLGRDTAAERTYFGAYLVDVHPPGREPYRARIESGTEPSSLVGLVLDWFTPAIVDRARPDQVHVLEPPCGPDLPLVEPQVQRVRDARDLRTATLHARYAPPSARDLALVMAPTASATHPSLDAVCFRFGLLTTGEARATLDRIRSDGNAWDRMEARLYSHGPSIPDALRDLVGRSFAHLMDVAPQRRELDLGPFWTLGVAVVMRDLHPAEVDPQTFAAVMRPFVEVCGPLPDGLA